MAASNYATHTAIWRMKINTKNQEGQPSVKKSLKRNTPTIEIETPLKSPISPSKMARFMYSIPASEMPLSPTLSPEKQSEALEKGWVVKGGDGKMFLVVPRRVEKTWRPWE